MNSLVSIYPDGLIIQMSVHIDKFTTKGSIHNAFLKSFLINFFYFYVMVETHAVLRNTIEKFHVHFTLFIPTVMYYKSIQYHNHNIDIEIKVENISISTRIPRISHL